ncbi:MAPK regulated corepressor interacting protein 2-like isoform X1 [Osmerus mordax]|uniref:MAPK regulated corepressor interacting protein 2-like isoform X1 n=1 Tax=Osmerus mordax TaxID=8014 RepID=UPI00350FC00B
MMYTITKGPSKLVTQRRTGPTQPIDNKINEFKHKQTPWIVADIPSPKLVFNRLNGKKHHPPPAVKVHPQSDGFTAAHEENVTFVNAVCVCSLAGCSAAGGGGARPGAGGPGPSPLHRDHPQPPHEGLCASGSGRVVGPALPGQHRQAVLMVPPSLPRLAPAPRGKLLPGGDPRRPAQPGGLEVGTRLAQECLPTRRRQVTWE